MKRRLKFILPIAALLLLGVWFGLPAAVSPILRDKLQRIVSDQLHARLEMDTLRYRFPYGISVENARFIGLSGGDEQELLQVENLELSLAELPVGGGPLVIERILIHSPTVKVIRTAEGVVGTDLVKSEKSDRTPRTDRKLSEILRLRKLALDNGRVMYVDRTRPDVPPTVYENLRLDLNITPKSGSEYDWHFLGAGGTLCELTGRGSADVDALRLELQELVVSAALDPDAAKTALPPQLQQIVDRYDMRGNLTLTAKAHLPLREPAQAEGSSRIELRQGTARVQEMLYELQHLALDVRVEKDAQTGDPQTQVNVQTLEARGAGARLTLQRGQAIIDPLAGTWQVPEMTGKAFVDAATRPTADAGNAGNAGNAGDGEGEAVGFVDFSGSAAGTIPTAADLAGFANFSGTSTGPLQQLSFSVVAQGMSLTPPRFPRPLEGITGAIDGDLGGIRVSKLSATYGNDSFFIATATVPVACMPNRLEVNDLMAEVRFAPPSQDYPEPLTRLIAELNPAGQFYVTGKAALVGHPQTFDYRNPDYQLDYDLALTTTGAGVWLMDTRVAVSELKAQIFARPELIELRQVEGKVFDGSVAVMGMVKPGHPTTYDGRAVLSDVDLELAGQALFPEATGQRRLAGRVRSSLGVRGEFHNTDDLLAGISGDGEVEVSDGVLWEVPVLSHIVGRVKVAREALSAGQAAAVFQVRDQRVALKRAAINSPALGVTGSGVVGFDGKLDMQVVAAPLGDWRNKLKSTGIPVVSAAVGELAGGIQKILNTATSELLYEFRVDGSLAEPNVRAVPAPILTDAAGKIFRGMLREEKTDAKFLQAVGDEAPQQASTEEQR